jgi:hypothetical protein
VKTIKTEGLSVKLLALHPIFAMKKRMSSKPYFTEL